MRHALSAALLALTAACAASNKPPQQVGDNPRDVGVATRPQADDIPLLTAHGVKGCRYRSAGQVVASSPAGLRDQAYQKLANAVIDVRQGTQVIRPVNSPVLGPATSVYFVGTAVRFDDPSCAPAPR
jgi:hypothetical protein